MSARSRSAAAKARAAKKERQRKEVVFYIEARCGDRRIAGARLRILYEGLLNVGGLVADGWYAIRHKSGARLVQGRILRLRK